MRRLDDWEDRDPISRNKEESRKSKVFASHTKTNYWRRKKVFFCLLQIIVSYSMCRQFISLLNFYGLLKKGGFDLHIVHIWVIN